MITCVSTHCFETGNHKVTCRDHPGWAEPAGICGGCLPRRAEIGFTCRAHYERVVNAVSAWRDFRRAVDAAEGRLVSTDSQGIKTSSSGYANLTLAFLTISECETFLASRADRTVDLWVHDEQGAADAVRFAAAAERAFRDLEVVERETPVTRQRCPGCDRLTLTGNPSREVRGLTVVECQHCGHLIDEVRMGGPRWAGSGTCEERLHADCESLTCRCVCHFLGARSRPGGVQALWDADQHVADPSVRASWVVRDVLSIEPREMVA